MEEELEETKLVIRSVLNMVKETWVSLNEFLKLYKEMDGQPLPFSTFGFRSVREFLASLTDTVVMRSNGYGEMISSVPDAKSDHIHNLVSEQRDETRSKKRSGGRRLPFHYVPRRPRTVPHYTSGPRLTHSRSTSHRMTSPSTENPASAWASTRIEPPKKYPAVLPKSKSPVQDENQASSSNKPLCEQKGQKHASEKDDRSTSSKCPALFLPATWYDAAKKAPPKESAPRPLAPKSLNVDNEWKAEIHQQLAPASASTVPVVETSPNESKEQSPPASSSSTVSSKPIASAPLHQQRTMMPSAPLVPNVMMPPFQNQFGLPIKIQLSQAITRDIYDLLCMWSTGLPLTRFNHFMYVSYKYWIVPEAFGYCSLLKLLTDLPFVVVQNNGSDLVVYLNHFYGPPAQVFHSQIGVPPSYRGQGVFQFEAHPMQLMYPTYPMGMPRPMMAHGNMGQPPAAAATAAAAAAAARPPPPRCVKPPPGFLTPVLPVVCSRVVARSPAVHNANPPPGFSSIVDDIAQRAREYAAEKIEAASVVAAVTNVPLEEAAPPQEVRYVESPFRSVSEHEDSSDFDAVAVPTVSRKVREKVNSTVTSYFRQILANRSLPLFLSDLPMEYRRISGHSLNAEDYGCHSVLELVGILPDVFKLKRTSDTTDWFLYSSEADDDVVDDSDLGGQEESASSSLPPVLPSSPSRINLSKALQRRIVDIVRLFNNGLVLDEFLSTYKLIFDEDFKFDESTGNDLNAIFQSMSDILSINFTDDGHTIFHCVGDVECFFSTPPSPSMQEAPVSPADVSCVSAIFVSEKIHKSDESFQVEVSHVIHPSHFYVRLIGGRTSAALVDLMANLAVFYGSRRARDYALPLSGNLVGRVCVAIYDKDGHFYRAVIVAIVDMPRLVTVRYVDFGNSAIVDVGNLYQIKEEFMELPSQAICAQLNNVLPGHQNVYSSAAIRQFRSMTEEKLLNARLCQSEMNMISLILHDPSGNNDLSINETLVLHEFVVMNGDNTEVDPKVRMPKLRTNLNVQPVNLKATNAGKGYDSFCRLLREDLECPTSRYRLMSFSLLDSRVHIVYTDGDFFVPTFEVSKFIWTQDILRMQLNIAKFRVDFHFIEDTDDAAVHAKLQKLKCDVDKHSTQNKKITLFPLRKAAEVMANFSHSSIKMKNVEDAFKQIVEHLN